MKALTLHEKVFLYAKHLASVSLTSCSTKSFIHYRCIQHDYQHHHVLRYSSSSLLYYDQIGRIVFYLSVISLCVRNTFSNAVSNVCCSLFSARIPYLLQCILSIDFAQRNFHLFKKDDFIIFYKKK